ncbi:MAG: acetate--CoA ligase family protein [Deltaproteobacteria bacterium]|nr:acetate--CoA ligase family protein [Deltaproteobacteria bacterium]
MSKSLLNPKSVAIIGASTKPGKVGYEILSNMVDGKFEGPIVPVNPGASEICGVKCYPRLQDYDGKVELSIVVVPPKAVYDAVKDSIYQGAKAVVIITAGFREVDAEGLLLENKIAALCDEHRVKLLGPNCLGAINPHHNMNASFANHMPDKGGISVISQSGALCTAILDWAASRHLGLARLVSMGNKAGLDESDFLDYLSKDDETKVIVGYLESINNGKQFIQAAKNACMRKPVVIFKSGVTQAGGKAASSHTGSLAGADMAYGAAFRRSGVVRADTFESMFDYAMAFAMQPLPKGDRVAIITNAGGPGIMAADAVELSGMQVSPLAKVHASALAAKLPKAASVSNPIDVLGDADPQRYVDAVVAAQKDDSIDAIIVILTPQAMSNPDGTAIEIAKHASSDKPVLVSFMGGLDVKEAREKLIAYNIPDYPSPERAVNALRAMWEYQRWLNRPPRVLTRFPVNRHRVERIINRQRKTGQLQLGEAAAKDILKAYEFKVPVGALAQTREEAVAIANHAGFPVAMKIASPHIIHKSDMGGVKLNLGDAGAVEDAYDLMMLRIRERAPQADIHGVYVEKMCKRGRECILGMTRDPQFGPMLMFGLGGIFVEVMKDVTFNIAPVTHDEAMQMLESTKSFALLKGTRGQKEVDLSAIAVALQRISQLVTEFPEILEMDINPFMVGEIGDESIAADARITLSEAPVSREVKK